MHFCCKTRMKLKKTQSKPADTIKLRPSHFNSVFSEALADYLLDGILPAIESDKKCGIDFQIKANQILQELVYKPCIRVQIVYGRDSLCDVCNLGRDYSCQKSNLDDSGRRTFDMRYQTYTAKQLLQKVSYCNMPKPSRQ